MKLSQITEKTHYTKTHRCETPDAVYTTKISGKTISVSVKLPFDPNLTKDESAKIEATLHYAVEKVLVSLFK